jgi:hypothetical protein
MKGLVITQGVEKVISRAGKLDADFYSVILKADLWDYTDYLCGVAFNYAGNPFTACAGSSTGMK